MTEPTPSSEAPSRDSPGRVALADLAHAFAKIPARELATQPPVLLVLGDASSKNMGSTTTAFQTVNPEPAATGAPARPDQARFGYPLAKRAGANAFAHMITLGRAKNNDLVIADPAVSKFHVSFTRAPDGSWTLTDASSNGTWLDGTKLARGRAVPLRSGSTIGLAKGTRLLFLPASDLIAFLGTRRTGS